MMMFSRQMATMLETGVTLIKAINILLSQVESKKLMEILHEVKKEVEGGKTLRSAMSKYPKVFSIFWLNLIEIGEASGHLTESLNEIALFQENSHKLREKIISALIYPSLLIAVSIAAILIFTMRIVPIFAGILTSFNVELPALTQGVMWATQFLNHWFLYLATSLILGVVILKRLIKTPAGGVLFNRITLKIPLIGEFLEAVYCERIASTLGTLLQSGVSILHALDIVEKTVTNRVYRSAIGEIKEEVRQGKPLAIQLENSGLFPMVMVQMITVGEEVGELGKMLQRFSSYYQGKIDTMVSRLTALIEPVILLFMGAVIGTLVIAMFLPIFKLSKIGGH
jgi:type IV pilus assembly protein PilC